jgi:prepilin-type N-terminal cleavage/methylation domain-containing protein
MRLDRLRRTVSIVQLRQSGFSLLELMAVLAILSVVLAVVMSGVTELQKKSSSETAKVDLTQQSRQFMDQIVRDLHHAGYPSVKMFEAAVAAANPPVRRWPDKQSSTGSLQFEGDCGWFRDSVPEVFVQLVPAGGPCPLPRFQRGAVSKHGLAGRPRPSILHPGGITVMITQRYLLPSLNDGTSDGSALYQGVPPPPGCA